MPGGREIKAGSAYVELKVLDTVGAGLRGVGSKLRSWGAGISSIGSSLALAGAAGLAPFLAAVNVFSDMGADLLDMSQRTGVSVEALSALGFAATQSGAEMGDLEVGIKKMQDSIVRAAAKAGPARTALEELGLSVADLKNLTPDEQFKKVSAALVAIDDPAKRTALALDLFGKSGTKLLPTMMDLAKQVERHDQLGIGWTTEEAEAAEAFGDVMGELWAVLKKAWRSSAGHWYRRWVRS